jgi:hypothetical protein
MSERLAIGDYEIEFDRDATVAAYSRFTGPEPEKCLCWYCRNWSAGRDLLLSDPVRALLDKLGVPADGEIEVWEVPGDNRPHLCGGWYMIVGRLVRRPQKENREFSCGGWHLSWSSGPSYRMEQFGDQEVCELHFTTPADNYIPVEFDLPT